MSQRPPRLVFLLNSAQRRLQQWIGLQQAATAGEGVSVPTAAQSGLLFILDKRDGASMGELAGALKLVPSALSGLVQRMEAIGWVLRRTCTEDARTQRVWLQAGGRGHLPSLKAGMVQINQQLAAGFTADELETVARWLSHVQSLSAETPEKGQKAAPVRKTGARLKIL
ncbi:MarR family transcriptional regulator [Hydrogenophaga sp. PAMC20947]|uniref:MarR family winged helix-turn-helix transcriptional regulator n=1 Tax=Hydrogenophaga sp. PAMC20947 TaxID=2565558 RepID=UPI00109DE585|nr:MarR family transcriptional regulator [Hydrogenophaga sp. PAMC20947]QCB44603.1 MarR family transcriptional regulator [Hydrogenophaga sp. PAMC20947]